MRARHLFPLLCLFLLLLLPEEMLAQGITAPRGVETYIADFVTRLISWLNIGMWMIFVFLNFLLDPYFIFDLSNEAGGGSFMTMLNQIWQLSRDLMNVAFAFLLIGAAIYVILTANKELIQSHIRKFIMAVILVNFSWFIPQVIIDISNVAAAAVYGVPSLLAEQGNAAQCRTQTPDWMDNADCHEGPNGLYDCKCLAVVDARFFLDPNDPADSNILRSDRTNGWFCYGQLLCIRKAPLDANTVSGHSAILNGLIVNHARLQTLARVPEPPGGTSINQLILFLVREVVVLTIHIALFFPMLALLVAFAMRIPILWLTIAFMPFFFLQWVATGEIAGYAKKIGDHFLKAAFLPAMVAVPLAVGFIMINAGSQISFPPLQNLSLKLIDSIQDAWALLWLLMSLVVMWIGVFSVLGSAGGPIASVTGKIKTFGQETGKFIGKVPLALPLLPGPGGSPLHVLKQYNPVALQRAIEGREGIMGLANIGKQQGGNATQMRQAVETIVKDPNADERTRDLTKEFQRLREALRDNRDTAPTLDAIRQNYNLPIRKEAIGDDVEYIQEEFKRFGKELDRSVVEGLQSEWEKRVASITAPVAATQATGAQGTAAGGGTAQAPNTAPVTGTQGVAPTGGTPVQPAAAPPATQSPQNTAAPRPPQGSPPPPPAENGPSAQPTE